MRTSSSPCAVSCSGRMLLCRNGAQEQRRRYSKDQGKVWIETRLAGSVVYARANKCRRREQGESWRPDTRRTTRNSTSGQGIRSEPPLPTSTRVADSSWSDMCKCCYVAV